MANHTTKILLGCMELSRLKVDKLGEKVGGRGGDLNGSGIGTVRRGIHVTVSPARLRN